jgi:ribosomal protein S21
MRHEGQKQGLYREMKIQQLGEKTYTEMERRARSIVKRSDSIRQLMGWLSPPRPK